jgi:hypothetical protein
MKNRIICFIPDSDKESLELTTNSLRGSDIVENIHIIAGDGNYRYQKKSDNQVIKARGFYSTDSFKMMAEVADTKYILIYTKTFSLDLGRFALERMIQVCDETGAGMVYSDYFENKKGHMSPHPVIDYQVGSLRDDFNFGSVMLFNSSAFIGACARMDTNYQFAALYDLRLKISQSSSLVHIPEMLYTEVESDTRKSGEKQFDYVDPKNRAVQIEMEAACSQHLRDVKAFLKPVFRKISFDAGTFQNEASVIIPVKNRVKTLSDAILSVLTQKTNFSFNLIIIDNHSNDGTGELIDSFASKDKRIVHLIPERKDLGIGGCWNEGVFNEHCGRFAIQLDSDDLYIDDTVIARIVEAFYNQQCAMVVGSYKMVNFNLEDIPPGLIDHREWTPENGRNNALRINGLGAPRAFYTPVLRTIRVPNVSYGEDYAVGLAISRYYQIGRIMEPLYLCRRWDENSDASLDVNRMNSHNLYKDKIRTYELLARMQLLTNSDVK